MNEQQQPAEENPGHGKTRDGRGRFIRDLADADRDTLAARLRATGMSYREIAAKLQYSNESGAHKAVSRALAAVPVEAVNELRALECARLDELTTRLWDVLNTRYPLLSPGVELVGSDGKPVADPAIVFAAVDRLARISEQRAKLLGLNVAPPRPAADPKPAALELTGQQAALLQRLLRALEVEVESSPLALPMIAETPREGA